MTITTPAGPGICGRSPDIQKAILHNLTLNLCQVISDAELFRITHISGTSANKLSLDYVRAGDFQGLINVQSLGLRSTNIQPRGLAGLDNLKKLELSIAPGGTLAKGAFQDLESLETLSIDVSEDASVEPGAFQGLTNLETLHLNGLPTMQILDGMPNLTHIKTHWVQTPSSQAPLQNLPNLQSADIGVWFQNEDSSTRFQLPNDMFKANPKLNSVRLAPTARQGDAIHLPRDLFSNNLLLERVEIASSQARLPKDLFQHLENLEQLQLHQYWSDEKWHNHDIVLHESSPLYIVFTVGGRNPSGFRLSE